MAPCWFASTPFHRPMSAVTKLPLLVPSCEESLQCCCKAPSAVAKL